MRLAIVCLLTSIYLTLGSETFADPIAPGKSGAELIDFLRTHYRPTTPLSYRGARERMFSQIDNNAGKVRCVYTGVDVVTSVIPPDATMNTEHTWPQSKFQKRLPMRADLHHLFPTLSKVNNVRSNNPFAEIPDQTTTGWWRSNTAQQAIPSPSDIGQFSESMGTVFEPREDHKGNTARALLYVWAIYGNDNISADWVQPQLPTLVQWHESDPIDDVERTRNASIKAVQGNDNPFVLDATLLERVLATDTPGSPVTPPRATAARNLPRSGRRDAPETAGRTIRIVGWNLQSDFDPQSHESNPDFIRSQMAAKNGVDIWGLCEVLNADALKKFEAGAEDGEGADFISVMGTTGGRDKLAVLYDSQLFEQVGGPLELKAETQLSSGLRASLGVWLKAKQSGEEFLVLVNHLKRGEAQNPVRLEQSKNLNQWARGQTLPVIALGDWNYDYDVVRGDEGVPDRDAGFDALIEGNVFEWVRPSRLVKSQADDRYNTLLDFVFAARAPSHWAMTSRILERDGDDSAVANDFDDDSNNSDHRPVDVVITIGDSIRRTPLSRAEIVTRIETLEMELAGLRRQLDELDDN